MIKVTRTTPAPVCLEVEKQKKDGDYKCGDVLDRLAKDFKDKCYLCEDKDSKGTNVEHLVSHKGDKKLKFDWNNLFLSCPHCNNTKLAIYDSILDCTNPAHDVENWIYYEMKPFPKENVKIIAKRDTPIVRNTVELLLKIYNGSTKLKTYDAKKLRNLLLKELKKFQNSLEKYYDEKSKEAEKKDYLRYIKWQLSRASAFTAFKRWIVKENPHFLKEFGHYFD